MTEPTTLETPRVRVTLDTGETLDCQVLNPDYLRWDRTAAKHGWGAIDKVPFTWLTFVAWSALRREQQIPADMSWEEFSERRCVQVQNLTEAAGETEAADPTPAAPVPG